MFVKAVLRRAVLLMALPPFAGAICRARIVGCGNMWETGGFLPSVPGRELQRLGYIAEIWQYPAIRTGALTCTSTRRMPAARR